MTEPKAPSFNGVEIRVGDEATISVVIDKLFPGHPNNRVQACLSSGSAILVDEADLVSLTPAPRPLVPGPAVYRQCLLCTIKYISEGEAWIVFSGNGESLIVSAHDLRNTEGAAS